jgi:hypothetical protein
VRRQRTNPATLTTSPSRTKVPLPSPQACLGRGIEGEGQGNRSQRTPVSVTERAGTTRAPSSRGDGQHRANGRRQVRRVHEVRCGSRSTTDHTDDTDEERGKRKEAVRRQRTNPATPTTSPTRTKVPLPSPQACLGRGIEGEGQGNRSQPTPVSVTERAGTTRAPSSGVAGQRRGIGCHQVHQVHKCQTRKIGRPRITPMTRMRKQGKGKKP